MQAKNQKEKMLAGEPYRGMDAALVAGGGAIVLPGVRVGDAAVIGAGSTISVGASGREPIAP